MVTVLPLEARVGLTLMVPLSASSTLTMYRVVPEEPRSSTVTVTFSDARTTSLSLMLTVIVAVPSFTPVTVTLF